MGLVGWLVALMLLATKEKDGIRREFCFCSKNNKQDHQF